MTAAIHLDGVHKVYGRGEGAVRALDGLSMDFEAGSFTAVMGPSGSCKSTFLHVAFGVGLGTVIAYGSLMLFAHATGADAPYVPIRQLALILGGSVALGFVGSQIPTRIALRARPVDAIVLRD